MTMKKDVGSIVVDGRPLDDRHIVLIKDGHRTYRYILSLRFYIGDMTQIEKSGASIILFSGLDRSG